MGGQFTSPACGFAAAVAAVLLAAGCNQLTGVGDLKVSRCGADAGPDAGVCETERRALTERDAGTGGAGTVDNDPESGRTGGGGSTERGGGNGGEPGGSVPRGAGGMAISQADPTSGSVGAACDEDEDCSGGLGCTTAQATSGPFLGGGVQGGFCSRPCAGDADCVGADLGAICVSHASGPAFCFPECSPQLASFPDQCNGRSELLCLPLSQGQRGYCAPACQTDDDCSPRSCNLATGLCSDSVNEGELIGGACSGDGDCAAGLCLSLPGQPAACTGLCTLGSAAGCGFSADESEPSAACTNTGASAIGLGLGVGLCQELCNVDEDCLQAESGWGCTPWPDEERFGSAGFCEPLGAVSILGCNDSCLFANNDSCDDETSFLPLCDPGTDCSDCASP